MILKRTSPSEMLSIVQAFQKACSGSLSGSEVLSPRFLVVPRYNALLRSDSGAIRRFFSFMSLRGSHRARALEVLLRGALHSRFLLKALMRAGHVEGVLNTDAFPGVKWSRVDALVAEWQFVACFSSDHTVTHCLAHPKYEGHLDNELVAREEVVGIVPIPELVSAIRGWPSGWTEAIVGADRKANSSQFSEIQRSLLDLYRSRGVEASVGEYLVTMRLKAEERYAENEFVLERIVRLIKRAEALSGGGRTALLLARCHGDLNLNQVLVEDGKPYLIDWSESEVAAVFHDYVYSAVFHYRWREFSREIEVPELEPMKTGLGGELSRHPPAFYIGVMLAEVGVKQHVDYNERRGTLKGWTRLVDSFLEVEPFKEAAHASIIETK